MISKLNLNKLATYLQHPEGWLNMASDQYKQKEVLKLVMGLNNGLLIVPEEIEPCQSNSTTAP